MNAKASEFNVRDMMIIIAGIALTLSLFRIDARPQTFGGRDDMTCRQSTQYELRLLADAGTRWRSGFPLVIWYLLAGPTIAGPILFGVHRKSLTVRPLLSGKILWGVLGFLIWFEIVSSYFTCWFSTLLMDYQFDWRDHHPLFDVISRRLWEAGQLFPLLLFFGIPVATLVVFGATRRRRTRGEPLKHWMDRAGLILGWLWSGRDVLLILAVFLNPGGYIQLP